MRVELTSRPAFAFARLHLAPEESTFVQPGAMATMRGDVSTHVSLGGGVVRALVRKTADETSIMAKYTGGRTGGYVGVAPPHPGDLEVLQLDQTGPVRIVAGAVLAYDEDVQVSTRFIGVRRFMLREGFIGLQASGTGQVLLSAFGAIEKHRVAPGESFIVDSGHILAWSDGMPMDFGPLGGLARSGMIREGFVGQFHGPGVVLVQTRMDPARLSRRH